MVENNFAIVKRPHGVCCVVEEIQFYFKMGNFRNFKQQNQTNCRGSYAGSEQLSLSVRRPVFPTQHAQKATLCWSLGRK